MSADEDRKLFVAGLSDSAHEDTLRDLFRSIGQNVVTVSIPRDRATGKPRGFGFVTLEDADQAQKAREQLNGTLHEGRSITVRPFRSERPAHTPGRGSATPRTASEGWSGGRAPGPRSAAGGDDGTLYVGNLPFDATPEQITELFAASGFTEVVRVHLPSDPEGRKRGFGFVTLKSEDEARRAAEQLSGTQLGGRSLSVNPARRGGGGGAGGGSSSSGQHHQVSAPRAPRSFDAEPRHEEPPSIRPSPGGFADMPVKAEEGRRGVRKEKKKDKKRKGRSLASERSTQSKRRKEGDFRSSRARDYIDKWDDD